MASLIKEFEHLEIPLEEIKSATNNFDNSKVIGKGGFGKVYVGEVSHSKGRNMVAIKRLDSKLGQGGPEFLKEITMLSCYTHENLISLLGFCNQEDEMILLYEYASNGSLDRHLGDTTLTWRQRIKICLDAAKGLSYLHDPNGAHQRVLHCDIKSANILLDDQWNGKVSDFGLSKIGPANQQNSFIVTNALGTFGYCDPLFMETYSLTKESDVYSFGVVLFEVLCGVLCFQYGTAGQFNVLVPMWKKKYKQNKIDEIVFPDIRQPMDQKALETFSDIAYQCLHKCRKERPVMAEVVEKLEMALESQEASEGKEWIIRTMVPPLNYTSEAELNILLCKGVLLNGGTTWFSLNDNEEHCVMISIADCLIHNANDHNISRYKSDCNSRFSMSYSTNGDKFQTHVRTRMLSPRITYIVNIVFKFLSETQQRKGGCIDLKYKIAGERNYSTVYLANKREDDWLVAELCYFISDRTSVDLEIMFDYHKSHIVVEGIEFRPLEKAGNEVLEDEKVDTQPISDEDTYWEKILPNDYEDIIKWSKDSEQWTTKKELYFILRKGFLVNNDELTGPSLFRRPESAVVAGSETGGGE
ncbi:protein kinase-like domain-containing protein [Artemisia annua]|uniref:Protein kinase-like domain-containing protein n=1 Tax=Artemisia annua TaxID=35608 RepID=A0A2U1PMA2_ARTAN|nr:protein kinase-like domain-containing protein [Artemisia annua]